MSTEREQRAIEALYFGNIIRIDYTECDGSIAVDFLRYTSHDDEYLNGVLNQSGSEVSYEINKILDVMLIAK